MIEVSVTMWGNLRRFVPRGAVSLHGKVVAFSTRLSSGDRVFLFDHLHGG